MTTTMKKTISQTIFLKNAGLNVSALLKTDTRHMLLHILDQYTEQEYKDIMR